MSIDYGAPAPPPPPPPPYGGSATPADVGALRIFILIALIVNALATLSWLAATVAGGAATCGIGCLLIVLPVFTGIAVWFDAVALSKLNQPPSRAVAAAVKNAAIFDIIAGVVSLSVIPLVMGILALVYLQKPEVVAYFQGGTAAPPPYAGNG
jgi:polyferredoxin